MTPDSALLPDAYRSALRAFYYNATQRERKASLWSARTHTEPEGGVYE